MSDASMSHAMVLDSMDGGKFVFKNSAPMYQGKYVYIDPADEQAPEQFYFLFIEVDYKKIVTGRSSRKSTPRKIKSTSNKN